MNTAVVSVGSNIEPERNVRAAKDLLAAGHELVSCSEFVRTEPIGHPEQPDFLNGAFLVRTGLNRRDFRASLKEIENRLGRLRRPDKYAARRIDLDIVVWNGRIVDRDYYTRDFVRSACRQLLPDLENGQG
ncbi:MAG: 2-amino-4-hydroxy-6-hydroxymethyldihydropteridine diphosphokinase [Candidatus Glassbacteria bacterium]|nr:2-amino-4-hydroxy-6-hydroxymethyldihydropteridine diphosphokinase [Candidatus Glassbacteria bacterium]